MYKEQRMADMHVLTPLSETEDTDTPDTASAYKELSEPAVSILKPAVSGIYFLSS